MPRDPMKTVSRLRHLAQDDARQALAQALATEATAAARAEHAARRIAEEQAAASSVSGNDTVVEAFAAWLPGARQTAAKARETCDRAGAEVARMRAILTASRAATEAVDTLMAQRAEKQAEDRARRIQADLDDAGRPRTE